MPGTRLSALQTRLLLRGVAAFDADSDESDDGEGDDDGDGADKASSMSSVSSSLPISSASSRLLLDAG